LPEGVHFLSDAVFQAGQEVEEYVIKKKLAEGGMAELYLARDRVLKRRVVIKALNHPFCFKAAFKRQFLREARIQANLDNPHIVQIFRAFDYRDRPCLVMQHVKGTDLSKVIKKAKAFKEKRQVKGALSLERAVHIFLQILEGVGFAHKYRIIHGDIKPSNILLDQQGRAKVADFGLAISLPYGRAKKLPAGTPHYMSPEQLSNEGVDFRTDIYALGVTFFCMLTGEPPLRDRKKMADLLEYHLEASPVEPRSILMAFKAVRPRIRDAILKALERDPNDRHQSCLEFELAVKEDAPHEIFSELLRRSLLAKPDITLPERNYLDEIALKKGLVREEAEGLERNIRRELGIPPLDFVAEYRNAFEDLLQKGRDRDGLHLGLLNRIYLKTGRISDTQARSVRETARNAGASIVSQKFL
jgi:serine/threonine protein kinase